MNTNRFFRGELGRSRLLTVVIAALLLAVVGTLFSLLSANGAPGASAAAVLAQPQSDKAQPQDCGLVWRVVTSPNNSGNDEIHNLYVVSANDIWAAGTYYSPEVHGMMQHWNGTVWSVVTIPEPGYYTYLSSISGTSATDIWAVGYYKETSTSNTRSFVIHWNGTQWSQVTLPVFGSTTDALSDIKALAPDAAWAVGIHDGLTLVLFWDGSNWASITSPSPNVRNYLGAVTAVSTDDMWAVGDSNDGSGDTSVTFTIHCSRSGCDGVTSPNNGSGPNSLTGVGALSTNDVYAVGYSEVITNPSTTVPFALHWDGIGWSMLPAPPIPPDQPLVIFAGMSALSSSDMWGVGYAYDNSARTGQTYAAHWDGSSWTEFNPPNRGTASDFNGSAAVAPNDIWAVGRSASGATTHQTLIEHYSDPCSQPSPTPVPTATPPGSCTIQFTDVPSDNTFYPYVICLACRGIISGYPCSGAGEPCDSNNNPYFRPSNPVSRGQLAKIVSNSAGFSDTPAGQTFEDVPVGSAFYDFVGRLASRDVMGGYACGSAGEPCGSGNLPYFRPGAGATRGQLTKIVSNAAGFNDAAPETYTFTDVPVGSTFHLYVERLLLNRPGVMGGYACGGAGEPCDSQNRSYFRPASPLTRGQTSKIVGNTFFPNCQTP